MEPGLFAAQTKPTYTARSTLPVAASGLSGRSSRQGRLTVLGGSGTRGGGSSSLGGEASRETLVETVSTMRGGGLAANIPGFDAAASALAAISVPALAWTGGPALFAQVRVI